VNAETIKRESSGYTHVHPESRRSLNKNLPARKLMTAVFWDRKGVLMVKFLQQGTKITSEVYFEILKNCIGRFGILASCVVLLHDHARPHRAARTRALLEHFNWELFDQPGYSSDLAPSDYHLFT
jgi:histone-lysine N-methyltransferase SETMAR